MTNMVKVGRNGRITIPSAFKKQLGIEEGDKLLVEATAEGILFTPIQKSRVAEDRSIYRTNVR